MEMNNKKNKIKEDMDFSQTSGSKPAPGIIKKINDRQTPLSTNAALPQMRNDKFKSFEEMIGSNSFQRVVKNLEKYTGQKANKSNFSSLYSLVLGTLRKVIKIENTHREELEKLAVELVMNEMGIEEGEIEFRVKIVGMQPIDTSGQESVSEEEQIEIEEKLFDKLSNVDLEVQKRRFINSLIHGAAVKGQYMFHLVDKRLKEINPQLPNLYGITMSIIDTMYWLMDDDQFAALTGSGGGNEMGKTKVVADENSVPIVYAKGATFAVLIHEIIKGVMEVYSLHGQPEDIEVQKAAMDIADSIDQETWDLRLGPAIWEQFREMYPEELFEEDKRYLEKYLIIKLYKMPTNEFNKMMKMILSKDPNVKQILKSLLDDIVDELYNEHEEEGENE